MVFGTRPVLYDKFRMISDTFNKMRYWRSPKNKRTKIYSFYEEKDLDITQSRKNISKSFF